MIVRLLTPFERDHLLWPDRRIANRRIGSLPVLSLDEQLELRRILHEASTRRERGRAIRELALRHGLSIRSIYRYGNLQARAVPRGPAFNNEIVVWASQRGLQLTFDDIAELALAVGRALARTAA